MNIEINGQNLIVREITVNELTTDLIEDIKANIIKEASEVAVYLTPEEKTSYMVKVWKEMPSKQELIEKIDDYLQSVDGIQWILNKSVTPQINIDLSNIDQYLPIIEFALGIENEKEETDTTEKN
jgi:hypothetical protein